MDKIIELTNILNKAARAEIGEIRHGRKKVAEGKWVSVDQQPKAGEAPPTSQEYTVQQHQDQSNIHFDEAMKYSEILNQLEEKIATRRKIDPRFKVPEKAQRLIDEVKSKIKFHKQQYNVHNSKGKQNWKQGKEKNPANKYQPQRSREAQIKLDQKRNTAKINKSLIELNELLKADSSFYVGLVVMNMKGQVLLGKRKEDGIWTGPGGGSDPGETPMDTAKREAFEEAGIDLNNCVVKELPTLEAKNKKPVFCFLVYCPMMPFTVGIDPDEEVDAWEWITPGAFTSEMKKDETRYKNILNGLQEYRGINKSLNDALRKTMVSMDHQGTAMETAYFAEEMENGPKNWLNYFYNMMDGFEYGDTPKDLILDNGYKLSLVKVDDGQYSGFVRKIDPEADLEHYDEGSVSRVEKMTIPAIIQFLTAKEYIDPREIINKPEEPQLIENPVEDEPLEKLEEPEPSRNYKVDLVHQLINLLDKLLD